MPIAASLPLLKTQLEQAFNAGLAGKPSLMSLQISSAIASILPTGLFPMGPVFIPPPPIGLSLLKSQLDSAFAMDLTGKPQIISLAIAAAIATLSPIVPPIGLSLLKTQLEQAFNIGLAGNLSLIALQMASAIVTYFQTGMVI